LLLHPSATQSQEGEGKGAFVKRVQQAIAQELGVPISTLTIQQKRQLMRAHLEGKEAGAP